ncbi:uncharacterized protein LOC118802218 [Colossoma macropomum]|uniref:uncharacterized protein LOC118802218 n=1 Tax=Colossoma macropomum TaxID=42526 RepID=UPI0018654A56|nr:uncharacterized protein LOC118802218 [Colossoma macropomum]
MAQAITELQVSISRDEEDKFEKQGFSKVDGNLNSGTSGPDVFLWFKKQGDRPITRIQFSFRKEMDSILSAAGFTKVVKDINTGTGGDETYLWYMSGTSRFDLPILKLKVTTSLEDEPSQFSSGWERLGCDLNRNNGGDPVYLWVKRDATSYISDITATINFSQDMKDLFQQGYIRVDEDTNRKVPPQGSAVFLWYRRSKVEDDGIAKIDVSLNKNEEDDLKKNKFTKVNKNLNDSTTGGPVYLWYKREKTPAIQFFTVLVGDVAQSVYKKAGFHVVEKNLNKGSDGIPLYVAYK